MTAAKANAMPTCSPTSRSLWASTCRSCGSSPRAAHPLLVHGALHHQPPTAQHELDLYRLKIGMQLKPCKDGTQAWEKRQAYSRSRLRRRAALRGHAAGAPPAARPRPRRSPPTRPPRARAQVSVAPNLTAFICRLRLVVNPLGAAHCWAWLARVLNQAAQDHGHAALAMLKLTSHMLDKYLKQFKKLLRFIEKNYLEQINAARRVGQRRGGGEGPEALLRARMQDGETLDDSKGPRCSELLARRNGRDQAA